MKLLQIILLTSLFFSNLPSFSQNSKQEQLEEQRKRLREEVEQIKQLRASNKLKERSVLEEVEIINSQINTRNNLIKITNKQANLLTKEINDNLKKIEAYQGELKLLKEDYAKMVVKSYKSKSQQSRIMFLLSSSDFTQAYKRLQYMKQYNKHRKENADRIENRTTKLQKLNARLSEQKKEKQVLIDENRETQQRLEGRKKGTTNINDFY